MNAISKSWKQVARQRQSDDLDAHGDTVTHRSLWVDPEAQLERRFLRRRIEDALKDMSPVYQRAIELQAFDGLSAQEIADRENVSLHTAKSWLKRARKQLKAYFEKGSSHVSESDES